MANILGANTGRPVNTKTIMLNNKGTNLVVMIDGDDSYDGSNTNYEKVLRAGCLMAQNTTTARWSPAKVTTVVETNVTSGSTTTFEVVNPYFFKVGDVLSVGVQTSKTITAIDYTTKIITVNSGANWGHGDVVKVTTGVEICKGILLKEVELRDPENRANVSKQGIIAISGVYIYDNILGDEAAADGVSGTTLDLLLIPDVNYQY